MKVMMQDKKRKVTEAIYDSIITGYELDCYTNINNYGMIVRIIFLEDGEWILLDNKEFSEIYNEVWKRLI